MRGLRLSTAIVLVLVAVGLGAVRPTTLAARSEVATLDGRVISVDVAAQLHCHDFDYPRVRCFRSAEEMLADIDVARSIELEVEALAVLSGYVTVYQDNGFGGPSRILSIDYPSLGVIGWNDRITSFKSFGATGHFREHSPFAGFTYSFGSSTQVSLLSASYNDKFSAFYIN